MNVIKLRTDIQTFLKTLCDRVYYERATDTSTYPYIVFNLVDSREHEGNREDFDLEVDIWDNAQDSTAIETLTGNVDGDGDLTSATGLHRKLFYTAGQISAKCYRDRRLAIIDEDVRIRHRQLRYYIQTYLT